MDIHAQDLQFRYPGADGFEVRFAPLSLSAGSSTAILGPSGSGKTTLLNLFAGLLAPAGGTLTAAGLPLHQMSESARREYRQSHVGYLFQDFALVDYLDVLGNVLLPIRLSHRAVPSEADRARALELLGSMGMAGLRGKAVTRLSKGEQQRVALCRALIHGPGLLLADEPTGNLDNRTKRSAVSLLREQARLSGATLVAVTHDREILDGFDRVLEMSALVREAP